MSDKIVYTQMFPESTGTKRFDIRWTWDSGKVTAVAHADGFGSLELGSATAQEPTAPLGYFIPRDVNAEGVAGILALLLDLGVVTGTDGSEKLRVTDKLEGNLQQLVRKQQELDATCEEEPMIDPAHAVAFSDLEIGSTFRTESNSTIYRKVGAETAQVNGHVNRVGDTDVMVYTKLTK